MSEQLTTPDDLVPPKRLAQLLSVHISTVHRWIRAGKVRAWKRAGERYLVSEAEGRALLVPVRPQKPAQNRRSPEQAEAAADQALAELRRLGYEQQRKDGGAS